MRAVPLAPHTARNSRSILQVLKTEFQHCSSVLEIGAGNGQHAAIFARELVHLGWQPSDREENLAAIRTCLAAAGVSNVRDPLPLDVLDASLPAAAYDAVFSANTAHIMSLPAVQRMFSLVAGTLRRTGLFCLYGPFRQSGNFNTRSNADFDRTLREQSTEMGIRDLEVLDEFARAGGMRRTRLYAMPANNFIAVWQKPEDREHVNA